MENPALAQQVKVLFLCGIGLLFACLVGWDIGSENYYPVLMMGVMLVLACIAFLPSPFFWTLTVASSFLAGTFPVLGGQFTPFQVLMGIGVARFFVADIILRRTRVNYGSRFDLLLIAGFMGVLTLHALHDRFGMKFLGSNIWGGRNYVNVYVGLAAFFVVRSVRIDPKDWTKLPYVVMAVVSFDAAIAIITTIFPSLIYKIYPFYSAVSIAGIAEIVGGSAVETPRLTAIGNFGVGLLIFVLSATSVRQLFHPSKFFRLLAAGIAGLAILFSSFRSAVFSALIVVTTACIRDLRAATIAFIPLIAGLLAAISIVNSEILPLPKQVQRSLAFLPGRWDADMKFDSEASNDFRKRVWHLWQQQYFPQHPLIGRGFGFKSEFAKNATGTGTQENNPNWDLEAVEVGNIHNGFFSSVDAIGIIGTVFFVFWNLRILRRTFSVTFRDKSPMAFTLRFLALNLGASIIFYWFGASTLGSFLPQEFAITAVIIRLQDALAAKTQRPERRPLNVATGEEAYPVPA
jgi:hypothetical protein